MKKRTWCLETETGKLIPVCESNEQLLTKLAGHVKIPGCHAKIPYQDTVTITVMAQDQGKRKGLKKVFHQLGLSLHTEDELNPC